MDILFWSGGKDAWLALEFYQREHPLTTLKLLTTYRQSDDVVPHQNIDIEHINDQADHLNLENILVPLPEDCPNDKYLEAIDDALSRQDEQVEHLVFGDWHLEDIRSWREEVFSERGYKCLFPIWQKNLDELLPLITLKAVEIRINAVKKEFEKYIRVGELYHQRFVQQLPGEIDPMGEHGEFHTKLIFKDWDDLQPEEQPLF